MDSKDILLLSIPSEEVSSFSVVKDRISKRQYNLSSSEFTRITSAFVVCPHVETEKSSFPIIHTQIATTDNPDTLQVGYHLKLSLYFITASRFYSLLYISCNLIISLPKFVLFRFLIESVMI